MNKAAELSRLLWEAREQIDMWADTVAARTGREPTHTLSVRDRIDAYRAEQGWSPDGFGGEAERSDRVNTLAALLDPAAGMGTTPFGDGVRYFAEKDIRAALFGPPSDSADKETP